MTGLDTHFKSYLRPKSVKITLFNCQICTIDMITTDDVNQFIRSIRWIVLVFLVSDHNCRSSILSVRNMSDTANVQMSQHGGGWHNLILCSLCTITTLDPGDCLT